MLGTVNFSAEVFLASMRWPQNHHELGQLRNPFRTSPGEAAQPLRRKLGVGGETDG